MCLGQRHIVQILGIRTVQGTSIESYYWNEEYNTVLTPPTTTHSKHLYHSPGPLLITDLFYFSLLRFSEFIHYLGF